MTDDDDFGKLLADLSEAEEPVLPFRWEDLSHVPVGLHGYRRVSAEATWSLALPSGRTIRLSMLQQGGTHAGILAGSARSDWFNDRVVKNAIEFAARRLDCEPEEIAVLQPLLLRSLEKKRPQDPGPEEIAVDYLPPVRTLAVFESSPVRDSDAMFSTLPVLWFQNAFGPPEIGHVTNQLRLLDWDRIASDGSL